MFKNKTDDEEEDTNEKRIGDNVKYDEDYYNNYIKQFTKQNRWNIYILSFLEYFDFSELFKPSQTEHIKSQHYCDNFEHKEIEPKGDKKEEDIENLDHIKKDSGKMIRLFLRHF